MEKSWNSTFVFMLATLYWFIILLKKAFIRLISICLFCFYIAVNQALDWTVSHGRVVALSYALFDAPKKLFEASDEDGIIEASIKFSTNDRVSRNIYYVNYWFKIKQKGGQVRSSSRRHWVFGQTHASVMKILMCPKILKVHSTAPQVL